MALFSKPSRVTPIFITASIILFLTLDFTMLVANFKVTQEVSQDALTINLAGRQRMLSQRMAKIVFQVESERLINAQTNTLVTQYVEVLEQFTRTLMAFKTGGMVQDAELNMVRVEPIEEADAQQVINQAISIILPLQTLTSKLKNQPLDPALLIEIHNHLIQHGDTLLHLMNQLTIIVEKSSQTKTNSLRAVQLTTFFVALINFYFIVRLFQLSQKQAIETLTILNDLLESTNVALLVFNTNNKIEMSNRRAQAMFGYSDQALRDIHREVLFSVDYKQLVCCTSDGRKIAIELHERTLHRNGKELTVVTVVDISHHIEKVKNLARLANYDLLTGVLNRNAIHVDLPAKMSLARKHGSRFACCFIDLDGFKQINDQYGHDSGDTVLKIFAKRLIRTLKDTDSIYRYGGDEFVLLLNLDEDDSNISQLEQKLNDIVSAPFSLLNERVIQVKWSAGMAVFPDNVDNADQLLVLADQLMYRSKTTHKLEVC
jgi:diguanylate cyclase (GGDEF)-like protein